MILTTICNVLATIFWKVFDFDGKIVVNIAVQRWHCQDLVAWNKN